MPYSCAVQGQFIPVILLDPAGQKIVLDAMKTEDEYSTHLEENMAILNLRMRFLRVLCGVSISVFSIVGPYARGQSTFGTIVGTITDPSRAVIPGVVVRLLQEEQGTTRTASTNDRGEYELRDLPEGTYVIRADRAGFKDWVETGVHLYARQELRIDISLQVGAAEQSMNVEGSEPVVNSESSTINDRLTHQLLDEFHTPAADALSAEFFALQFLPGATHVGNAVFKVGGARTDMTESKLNGGDMNSNDAHFAVMPVEEMSVVYVNANAEYRSPTTVDTVMQSGSNKFHGGANFQIENGALNAAGIGATKRPPGVPYYYGEYFGGGPVILPKIYNGHDRTFFYVDYQRSKLGTQFHSGFLDVPPVPFRNGNFANLSQTLVNPYTGQPFPGNIVPASMIYAGSQWLEDHYWPAPNTGDPASLAHNFAETGERTFINKSLYLRVDHQINTKNHLGVLLDRPWDSDSRTDGVYSGGLIPKVNTRGVTPFLEKSTVIGVTDTHIFSSTRLNELRVTVQHSPSSSNYSVKGQSILQGAGIHGIGLDLPGTPRIDITGFSGMWGGSGGGWFTSNINVNTRYQIIDNFTILLGRHTIKTGADLRRLDGKSYTAGGWSGTYEFTGRFTGYSWADFLLGLPDSATSFTPRPSVYERDYGLGSYIQDDFKLSSRLTLQYGLRYDKVTVPVDRSDAYFNFDPHTGSIVVSDQHALTLVSPAWPSTVNIVTAKQAGYPDHLLAGNWGRISPRLGLAFRPFNNAGTVIRAGYGHFADYSYERDLNTGGPFALTENFINQIAGGVPSITLSNPFPSVGTPPAQSATGINPNLRDAAFDQWNLTVERQIGLRTALRLSYIGSKSTFLPYAHEINRPRASTTPYDPSKNPYPNLESVSYTDNGGNATYHGLQIQAQHPFANGLLLDAAFTYQKELTDAHNEGGYFGVPIDNPYNLNAERGRADGMPMPFEFSMNYLYQLPIGHGRHFLGQTPVVLDKILGGWDLSGYFAAYSGRWWTPSYSGSDISNTNSFSGRPDQICNGNLPSSQRTALRWFNAACFVVPPAGIGRFGDSGVNIIQGPGAWFYDMGIYKNYQVHERLKLRIGMTTINLFNHPIWDMPQMNISGSNVGSLTSIPSLLNYPNLRVIKFQARLEF